MTFFNFYNVLGQAVRILNIVGLLVSFSVAPAHAGTDYMPASFLSHAAKYGFRVNTANSNKLKEFKRYLGESVESHSIDVNEPDSDPITVVAYKASQFEGLLIDDTSLDIEGADVGVNVKWLLKTLRDHIGKHAIFRCLLGIKIGSRVYIFKGEIPGRIVEKRGQSFGFLPVFLPDGADKTLAEDLPDHFNARYFAVKQFLANEPFQVCDPILAWDGKFQGEK